MKYIAIISLLLVGCRWDRDISGRSVSVSPYTMTCERVGMLQRCENKEAICYLSIYNSSRNPYCKFK